jgi:hypothetical protein
VTGRFDAASGRLLETPGIREHLATRRSEAMPACRECFLRLSCAGLCPRDACRAGGDMFATDSATCDVVRRINRGVVAMLFERPASALFECSEHLL